MGRCRGEKGVTLSASISWATCKILLTASLSIKKFRSAAGYELSDLQVIVIVSSVVYSGRNPMISGPFCGSTEIKSQMRLWTSTDL